MLTSVPLSKYDTPDATDAPDALDVYNKTQEELKNLSEISAEQIEEHKKQEQQQVYTEQGQQLKNIKTQTQLQESVQNEMREMLEGNPETLEKIRKILKNVDLTEFGIDNSESNKEYFEEITMSYFEELNAYISYALESDEVQIAETQEEKNAILKKKTEQFEATNFPDFFNEFQTSTESNRFSFVDILENAIMNSHEGKQALANNAEYLAIQNVKKENSLPASKSLLRKLQIDEYLEHQASFIMQETHSGGKFGYLTQGNIQEPFAEVIQFVRNGGGTLKPEAYSAYINMLNDKRHVKNKKWLNANIKNTNRILKNNNDPYKQQEINTKFQARQSKFVRDDRFYQLGMHRIAEKAQKIIEAQGLNITGLNKTETQQFTDSLTDKAHYAYTVENKFSEHADSSLEGQILGRMTVPNFFMDQLLRSGLMIMVLGNVLVGLKSGNWSGVAPNIIGGVLGINFLADGVMNSGIEKMLYPEKMLDNIIKESFNNKEYKKFFENEWEVSLAQNIDWSPKQKIKKDIKKDVSEKHLYSIKFKILK